MTPRVISNFRYGYTRAHARQIPIAEQENFDPTVMGFPSYIRQYASVAGFPIFSFQGGPESQGIPGEITGSQIGSGQNNQPRDTQTLANAMTYLKGAHAIKFGVEYRLLRFFANQNTNPVGSYSFNRNFTRGPIPTTTPAVATETGSSLASLLLGLPSSATFRTIVPITLYHHYGAAFVQTDWRARSNLTLNLGLRWDVETGTAETHRQITSFDLEAPSHLRGKVGMPADAHVRALRPDFTELRGLLSFPDGPQTRTNFNRFAPRVGFAWRLGNKMTVRGGYGISYVPQSLEQTSAIGVNFNTTSTQSSDSSGQVIPPGGTAQPTYFLTDPFRGSLIRPPGNTLGADTLIGESPSLVEPNRRTSYLQQYNFVIQRLLPGRIVIDVAYAGSHGVRLPFPNLNMNQLPPEYLDYAKRNYSTARDANGAAATSVSQFFSQQVTNPFYGIITNPNSSLSSRTVQRWQLLKPFPQYDSPQLFRPLVGASKYNSLQLSVRKTYSHGLSLMGNYVFSKLIDIGGAGNNSGGFGGSTVEDIYNIGSDYTISNLDVPHRFTTSFSYELPTGRSKSLWKRGYQVSGSIMYQSGTPVTIVANGFGLGYAVRRPDRVPGESARIPGDQMRDNIRAGGFAINPNAYAQPADYTLGNAARNSSDTRRDTYKNVNLSFLKNFSVKEGKFRAQLRGEFLNAFNMVVFGTPGNNVNNRDLVQSGVVVSEGTFARVRTQGNQPRIIQLVLRMNF